MLRKRLSAFSEDTNEEFFDFPDIQRLYNTIKKSRATEIPFRTISSSVNILNKIFYNHLFLNNKMR